MTASSREPPLRPRSATTPLVRGGVPSVRRAVALGIDPLCVWLALLGCFLIFNGVVFLSRPALQVSMVLSRSPLAAPPARRGLRSWLCRRRPSATPDLSSAAAILAQHMTQTLGATSEAHGASNAAARAPCRTRVHARMRAVEPVLCRRDDPLRPRRRYVSLGLLALCAILAPHRPRCAGALSLVTWSVLQLLLASPTTLLEPEDADRRATFHVIVIVATTLSAGLSTMRQPAAPPPSGSP